MRILRRRQRRHSGGTAIADRPGTSVADFDGTDSELAAEIGRLAAAHGAGAESEIERRLLALRHVAGIRALAGGGPRPAFPEPDGDRLPPLESLPEFAAADLTPGLIRAAVLRHGFVLVRQLVPRDEALSLAAQIDRAFAEREAFLAGREPAEGYYEEFPPLSSDEQSWVRPWIREGGGLLAADSPLLCARMVELFERAGILRLVAGYLGEPPLISLEKTTLRKAEPQVAGAWHQDGSFMGDVRALNLWLSLSRCGDESPGLDIVPRRLDDLVRQQTDEALMEIQVSQRMAEQAAGDTEILRPVFEPGDALFFDELFLHKTGSEPSMPKPRFAIENWFFGASAFPREYGPLAL